jgi:hypothetical protein
MTALMRPVAHPERTANTAGHGSVQNSGRTSSTAADSGSQSATARTSGGSCSRGKKMPDRNIIGVRNSVK